MGLFWDNGKENGNYRDLYRVYIGDIGNVLGLCGIIHRKNGKENGNYAEGLGFRA